MDVAQLTVTMQTSVSTSRSDWRARWETLHALPLDYAQAPAPVMDVLDMPAWPRDAAQTFPPCGPELRVEILDAGKGGVRPQVGDNVGLHYSCLLAASGCCVDSSRSKHFSERRLYHIRMGAGEVVVGMEQGLRTLELGTLARFHVPPHLGYGHRGAGPIKPDVHLVFEIELLEINQHTVPPRAETLLRRLLMLPPSAEQPTSMDSDMIAHTLLVHQSEAALAAAIQVAADDEAALLSRDGEDEEGGEGGEEGEGGEGGEHAALPSWLVRLRSTLPLPSPEGASFFHFAREAGALMGAPGTVSK